ncbi:hypothetical protein BH24DEI2_BH24DEI2_01230 [soil metagenome]
MQVKTKIYTLVCAEDRPYVYLHSADGSLIAALFVPGSVHTLGGQDDTTALENWSLDENGDETVLRLEARSSLWDKKIYRFRCSSTRFRFETEMTGRGHLTDVHYFGGYYSGQPRWGSGFFWSGHCLERGFNPEPTTDEDYYFAPSAGSLIDLTGVPIQGKAGWFFTPPPYCFAFEYDTSEDEQGWLGVGVEAPPGENTYTDFHYRSQRSGFHFSLAYEGHTEVDGTYELPALGFDFARDEYEALGAHVTALRARRFVPVSKVEVKPDWWREPIFCGWGSQCHLATQAGGHAPDFSRQEHYEDFLETLQAHDLSPGTVVVDDKWQRTYGENRVDEVKWPDLTGFIAEQHAAGRKVLLWLKAWDPEGVPVEECVTNAAGLPLSVDPTNGSFEKRFRSSVRTMLADYDADGFKLDFTARIPSGPGLNKYGSAWGLEMMRLYLGILYDETKKTKPDALLMTHTPHPYLGDVLDMIRLNDINTGRAVGPAMRHRARVASLALPDTLIDTDNWPMPDLAAWRAYTELQAELGIPSLYFVSHIDKTGEALSESDYALVRNVWRRHRAKKGTVYAD